METANYFKAPWGMRLKAITALSFVALVGLPAYLYYNHLTGTASGDLFLIVMPLFFLISALFTVRGYGLDSEKILVQRLLWQTPIDIKNLQSLSVDPEATAASVRTLGNGGLFSFSGKFRNKKLGAYTAYLTDHRLAVVLYFPTRKVVISPENPSEFERQLKQFSGLK